MVQRSLYLFIHWEAMSSFNPEKKQLLQMNYKLTNLGMCLDPGWSKEEAVS